MTRWMRIGGGLAIAGVLAAVIGWIARDGGTVPSSVPGDAPSIPRVASGAVSDVPGEAAAVPQGPAADAPESEAPSDASPVAAGKGGIPVTCRVEVAGNARKPAKFSLWFSPGVDREGESFVVEGADGVAPALFPAPGRYRIIHVWADGEEFPEAETVVEIAEGRDLALTVGQLHSLVLLARDAVSKSPLRDAQAWVESRSDDYWEPGEHDVPDPKRLVIGPIDADSEGCIRLLPARGELRVAVKAPGRAWTRLLVNCTVGQIPVDLVPGGSVRLRIENWSEIEDGAVFTGPLEEGEVEVAVDPPPDAVVEVEVEVEGQEQEQHRVWDPVPAPGEDGTILLEGLPCGPRRFEVRRGRAWDEGDLYGAATCEIAPGLTVELTIPTTPTTAGRKVPLAGTLVVPEEWGPLDDKDLPSLNVQGLERTNANVDLYLELERPGEGRTLTFTGDPVPPGRYRIQSHQFGWGAEFLVAEGAPPPQWTLPAPAIYRLRVLDGDTMQPVERATFRAIGEGGVSAWSLRIDRDAEEKEFLFRLPPGSWEVTCGSQGYEDASLRVEAGGPTVVRRTVLIRRGAQVDIVVRLDGAAWTGRVEFEISRGFQAEEALAPPPGEAGEEVMSWTHSMSTSTTGGGTSFEGVAPGEWTVRIEDLAGFESVVPRKVQLERGAKVEVVFDLERKK